ncbi:MAG: YdcF family protein [Pirellula sp.]|nr:YdcF family protein [Pirellula sp.]
MYSLTMAASQRLWQYLSANRNHAYCEAVIICCSYDLRVCDYACNLIQQGVAPLLILSGDTGNWTRHLWSVPEAHIFRERALQNGIAPDAILIEDQATNFGENIAFVRRLAPTLERVTFVTKPNSVLRVRLTIPVQWPGVMAFVDAPPLSFPEEVSNVVGILGAIDEMVGDVDRILKYPARGYQAPHELPAEILESWQTLKQAGFKNHLLRCSSEG